MTAIGDPGEDEGLDFNFDLITDAQRFLECDGDLSNYERRLAVREMRDILEVLLEESPEHSNDPRIDAAMKRGDISDAAVARETFSVLRAAIRDLLGRQKRLAQEISHCCMLITERWVAVGHTPVDPFEVKIRDRARLPATSWCLVALQKLVSLWTVSSHSNEDTSNVNARLKDLLLSVHAPDSFHRWIGSESTSTQQKVSLCDRLFSTLDEYGSIVEQLERLREVPPPLTAHSALALEQSAFEARELWIAAAEPLLLRIRKWELVSGVPLFAPLGIALRLSVGDPGDESVETLIRRRLATFNAA